MDAWPAWLRLLVAMLAVWRVSHLIVAEDGPWDVIVRMRHGAGQGILGRLMDCFYCTSLWAAAPAALVVTREPAAWVVAWLAISGGACLLERATSREPPAPAVDREEDIDGLLWGPSPPGRDLAIDDERDRAVGHAARGPAARDDRSALRR